MRIALATRRNLPGWEQDDKPLHAALKSRGVTLLNPAWDDSSFDWSGVDAVLIRTTWDYQDRREDFLKWATHVDSVTKLFNPLGIVRWNTHKSYLDDLARNGVRTIPTVWLQSGSDVNVTRVMKEQGWERAFIKPAVGSTARETLRFEHSLTGVSAAIKHLERLLPHEDMLMQPYMESVEELGERSAVFIDGEITHCVRKVPVRGDYRVQDDFGAHDELCEFSEDELQTARRAMSSIKSNVLYARADFLQDGDGRLVMNELELVEPSLFFRHSPAAAERLAEALLRRVSA